jgi:hypothetical protein
MIYKRTKIAPSLISNTVIKTHKDPIKGEIHVYAICWNEEKFLPFFLAHYATFCDKIFIYDNKSTDKSREIISAHPKAILKDFESGNQIRDDLYLKIKNHEWKKSRNIANWVIVCDIDEIFYHKNPLEYLKRIHAKGYCMVKPMGYNMASEEYPAYGKQITELVKNGVSFEPESKLCVFNPNRIEEMNYSAGCHSARPLAKNLTIHVGEAFLLHYKFLGKENFIERNINYQKRLSKVNIDRNWGAHYLQSREAHESTFNGTLKQSKPVI